MWIFLTGVTLAIASLVVIGCASLRPSEFHQAVLVRTDTPGAKILYHGEIAGVTPEYVRIRRELSPELQVRSGHQTTCIYESKLESKGEETSLIARPFNALDETYGAETVFGLEGDDNSLPSFWNWHNWRRLLPNTVTLWA